MNLARELSAYLEKVSGPAQTLRMVSTDRLRGLPAFLASAYRFHNWGCMGQEVILAESEAHASDISAPDAHRHAKQLSAHFGCPVVFVYEALEAYQRNRLVQLGVPFIVPGLQLYIPPFASLTEQFQRVGKPAKLSASAQVTVLYQILRRPPDRTLLKQWAVWLGYSAMMMTKVRDELVAAELCEREPGAKPRGLRFLHQGRALLDAARPVLRSPVRRVSWARFDVPPDSLPFAGLTALAKRSLIEDDAVPTYACREADWKRMLEDRKVRTADHADEAQARIEHWRYNPGLLAKEGLVDHLSLYLSLDGVADERMRLAANSLLEQVSW
ncbi:MAG: hypothetical protein V1929_05565 [bacterium]